MARVLVVDDDPAIRQMLCMVLNEEGFDTLTAADGQEALEILWKSEEPLVALLDYMMPRMTGVDTLRYLAEDPVRARRHAIVLMSALQEYPRLAAEVFPHAVLPFLTMPWTFEQLLNTIEQASERLHLGGATQR
jgi:CheY-like chemotaxis protein